MEGDSRSPGRDPEGWVAGASRVPSSRHDRRLSIPTAPGFVRSSAPYGVLNGPDPTGVEWDSDGMVGLCYGPGQPLAGPYVVVRTQPALSDAIRILECDLLFERLNEQPSADAPSQRELVRLMAFEVRGRSSWTLRQDSQHVTVSVEDRDTEALVIAEGDWWALRFEHGAAVGTIVARRWRPEPRVKVHRVVDLGPFEDGMRRAMEDDLRRGPEPTGR